MTPWQITFDDTKWSEDDLTGAEACEIAVRCGDGWKSLDPFASPVHLCVITGVLAQRLEKWDYDTAVAHLYGLSAAELLGTLTAQEE